MNVTQLLNNLTQQGVQLWAENDKLRIHSPKGVITPALQTELAKNKVEILKFLRENQENDTNICSNNQGDLSLQTIGKLIGGFSGTAPSSTNFKSPIISPQEMAQKLRITFRPLPKGYHKETIVKFRAELEQKLRNCGVKIEPWELATKDFSYEINIPLTPWKKTINTRVVKTGISAVIDVERHPNWIGKSKICLAENLYQFYSRFVWKNRPNSVFKVAQFLSWAEENIRPIEDPSNTQTIVITELDPDFIDPELPYQNKIPIGVNTLVRTFSEIVVGVSPAKISILNMNLSDSYFSPEAIDNFVLKSLIPKIYVPILPLPMSRFEVGEYSPVQSKYAAKLVKLGQNLATTNLLPDGFKIDDVIKRKSLRDIVDWMANGRTGVSYGFVAYIEPPQYIGAQEISEFEWEQLSPIAGFSKEELRQNTSGRRYVKIEKGDKYAFKQLPDIWLVSSRSGSKKTDLNLESDVLRIGLKDKLYLQLPKGIDLAAENIKPSYDIYVMVAIALASALYAPKLVESGAAIVHFHGYPAINWFESNNEYCTGVDNPSVPCGTYESGVFNFLGIHKLANKYGDNIALAALIEPDHGTNIIASDLDYLITRLNAGVAQGSIELGGKYLPQLKEQSEFL